MKKLISTLTILFCLLGKVALAQSDEVKAKLSKIAQQEFANTPEANIEFAAANGPVYTITNEQGPFAQVMYINDKYERLYIHVQMRIPDISEFKKYYINKTRFANIQKYLAKYKKSLLVGGWIGAYYNSHVNNAEVISITEYEEPMKGERPASKVPLPELFFDKNGDFIAKGDFDVRNYLDVHIDESISLDDHEGNGHNNHDADIFKINTKYYLRNVKHDLYMDVYGNSMEDRGRIVLYNFTSSTNQIFEILSIDASGKYKIQNMNSMKVLSGLPESTNIIQFESDEGERQIFEIEQVEGHHRNLVRLRLVYNGKYLGAEYKDAKNGTNIYERAFDPLDESMWWEFVPVEN
jgi:hypothetical protein